MKVQQVKIMLVDSDQSSLSRCSEILSNKGYRVETTTSPQEAIDKGKTDDYHLVATGLEFAGQMSGFELVEHMRKKHRHTCAIILSSKPTLDSVLSAIRLGVCDYLAKPVDENQLVEVVNTALSRRGIYLTNEGTINKVIGARLRELRRNQNLTTQQLANRVGVTQSQISQVETGRSAASVVTLYKISQAFDMSLSEVLEGV